MSTVTIAEARQNLDELLKKLPEEQEIVITDGSRPVAKLSHLPAKHSVLDIKPRSVGKILRPFPQPDDDLLGEMMEEKMDFPKLDEK